MSKQYGPHDFHSWTSPPTEVFTLPAETRAFSLFPDLPYELRHMIWLKALSHERLIKIRLYEKGYADNVPYNQNYSIYLLRPRELENDPIVHPILLSCSESREIAKQFYRVKFLCNYLDDDHPGTLRLCPEFDTLYLEGQDGFVYFADFAQDFYKKDRDGKGLLNLAISDDVDFPSTFPRIFWDEVADGIARLRRVIFQGGVMATRSRDQALREMPYSVPCCGNTTAFDRLPADLRAIDELERVYVRPRSWPSKYGVGYVKREWEKFLDAIEMDHSRRNYEEHLMLDLEYGHWDNQTLVDREDCLKFIQGGYRKFWESGLEVTGNLPPSVNGFWMVPMEALQEDEDGEKPDWVDIRDCPPELCVAHRG
jgi:hypothetical protein